MVIYGIILTLHGTVKYFYLYFIKIFIMNNKRKQFLLPEKSLKNAQKYAIIVYR